MSWFLVAIIVLATTGTEVLRAVGMKRHGEIHDFRPGALGKVLRTIARCQYIIGSVLCSIVAFFTFLKLLSIADLSFAVPATASSFVLETVLAKYALKESIGKERWVGALLVACGVALLSL
jgi:drug/metabolite transporter (DMT)-like permease